MADPRQTASQSSRREFLKRTAAAGAAFAAPTFIPARVLGRDNSPPPSETILIGAIGLGGRCNQLIDQVPAGGKIVAAADCYINRAADAAKRRNADWKIYQDYREMFDKEKLDAVVVATPDHGRTLPCILRRAGRARRVRREAAHRVHPRRPHPGRRRSASTTASSRSARSSARWRSTASAASSSATASSASSKVVSGVNYTGPRPLRSAARGADPRGRRLEHLVRPDASCGRSTASCSSAGCSGATTPAAR